MIAGRSGALPTDWSWQRKTALIVFALIMAYLHSFYILSFYVSEMEYWGTVWIGVTAEQRLLSFGLGLLANFGLIAVLLLRAPGRPLRAVVALSLTSGLLISVLWLGRDLWVGGLLNSYNTVVFSALSVLVRIFYAMTISLNLLFLIRISRLFWSDRGR
ncbi:MAG: hypothetical protein ACREIR_05580 [Geminicoccaceae bacterium]